MKTNKFFVQNRATTHVDIHDNRCEHDPMYTMLFFPDRERLLFTFTEVAISVIQKRYGKQIMEDKTISRIFGLLLSINDNEPRLLFILFAIYWERNIAKAIEEAFDGKGLFEEQDRHHFQLFISKMGEFVEKTIKFKYDKHNAIEIIDNYNSASRIEYVMGPF